MGRILAIGILVSALFASTSVSAFAGSGNPSGTGQPNLSGAFSCGQPLSLSSPANLESSTNPGSAFSPVGISGAVYANPGSTGGTSSGNLHVVAQYDIACYHVSQ